jgi:hypothetical protein
MANKLFGDVTENRTTSEVGVEPTTIVVGTTDNYSEEDYKLKFWAYIIETFFAHKQTMVLQW